MTKAKTKYDASHHPRIVKGMVDILWGSAWADHVEEHKCRPLSGVNICAVMPEPPASAWAAAERILGHIEAANPQWACNWPAMFAAAMRADHVDDPSITDTLQHEGPSLERFGECLMHMAMGAGVSWFDDHERFELEVPLCAETFECDLRCQADVECIRDAYAAIRKEKAQ